MQNFIIRLSKTWRYELRQNKLIPISTNVANTENFVTIGVNWIFALIASKMYYLNLRT